MRDGTKGGGRREREVEACVPSVVEEQEDGMLGGFRLGCWAVERFWVGGRGGWGEGNGK